MSAFLRIRVSFELGLSGCVSESADLMRGAIEYAMHGVHILQQPQLAEVWLGKERDKRSYSAYREAFERQKKERLFKGHDVLHRYWSEFSEWGSHSTKAALALRMRFAESEALKANFEFFETDHTRLSNFLLMLMDTTQRLEGIFHNCFRSRLTLDFTLDNMRSRFDSLKATMSKPSSL